MISNCFTLAVLTLCALPLAAQAPIVAPVAAPIADESAVPAEARGQMDIFLLDGQSNMSGKGRLADSTSKPHPRAWMMGNDYKWKPATEPLDDPAGQIDKVTEDASVGVGPGMAFALALTAQDEKRFVGLVPCAKGGRPLQFFLKPPAFDESKQPEARLSSYGSTLYRARQAQKMGRLAGVIFFQGEGDSNDPANVPQAFGARWGAMFAEWVRDLRADLNLPNLPIVFAHLGTVSGQPARRYVRWEEVKASQAAVAIPGVAMIKTDDLPTRDGVHFTTPAYEEIGRRFAHAMLELEASAAKNDNRNESGENKK